MKHMGKMKNNGARIVIAYRTIPGDPQSALVIGTQQLADSYHDSLMSLLESDAGQQTDEFADIMASHRFPDGSNMLHLVHRNGWMVKVPTTGVLITPDTKTSIPLDELNVIIAEQRGVTLADLAIKDGSNSTIATVVNTPTENKKAVTEDVSKTSSNDVNVEKEKSVVVELTPTEMRGRADALYKEAQRLRKEANVLDPLQNKPGPKKKTSQKTETVE